MKALHPLIAKEPSSSGSIPFLSVPALWQATAGNGIPGGLHGEGVRIAIADTGIDYLHRDFDGPGMGYAANDCTRTGDVRGYPGPRVVGGNDFAGDHYNASAGGDKSIPHPDPDPMDRYGHGTHVAGTAAGSGVTASRTTYTGPYDPSIDFSKLYIGPGVAPGASIYALKIFGCDGSTNLTDLALEWAVDPNQDGDFGDHLDVINLSLGSPYGWEYDTSVAAANNAALAGVIVVASAGNSGDIQLITSAPASADRAISVAATQHVANMVASFSSRGLWRGDGGLKPDVAAPGTGIVSAKTGTGSERVSSSGTSMAAPHVTGLMALLRQAHPDWSVEELKALVMNSAMPIVAVGTGRRSRCCCPSARAPAESRPKRRSPPTQSSMPRTAAVAEPFVWRARSGGSLYGYSGGGDCQQVDCTGTIRTYLQLADGTAGCDSADSFAAAASPRRRQGAAADYAADRRGQAPTDSGPSRRRQLPIKHLVSRRRWAPLPVAG